MDEITLDENISLDELDQPDHSFDTSETIENPNLDMTDIDDIMVEPSEPEATTVIDMELPEMQDEDIFQEQQYS